jgi:hypothetical protein
VQPAKNRSGARQKGTENHPQNEQRTQEEDGDRECRIEIRSKKGCMNREWPRVLPARAISQPVQTEDVFLSVAQPGRNFSHLKRLISGAEVAIEQLCDFFSRGRLLDLVQGAQDMLVETVVRIWNLAHLRFSGLKAGLLNGAHFAFGLVLQNKSSGSRGTGRYQLQNQSANCLRLMLASSARQSIRPFKAVEPFHSQFSILTGSRSGDRHPPLSAFVTECMFDTRNNFSA